MWDCFCFLFYMNSILHWYPHSYIMYFFLTPLIRLSGVSIWSLPIAEELDADVELEIKRFSLIDLIYQLSFNTIKRSYVVYGLTIRHNRSYFNTYRLYWLIPTKQKRNKWPRFLSGSYHLTFQSSKIISPEIRTNTT